MADLSSLKGVADRDRRMIADAEALLGPIHVGTQGPNPAKFQRFSARLPPESHL